MTITPTTSSQHDNIRRIGKALSSLTLALGLCSAAQLASAAHVFVPPGPWDGISAPGIPAYAQVGIDSFSGDMFILHDEEWAAIPFYRDVSCVPHDFNLLGAFDLNAWNCALLVEGPEVWLSDGIVALTQGPVKGYPAPTVYLVKYTELLAAIGDGILTLEELNNRAVFPSLKIGRATFWSEVNSSRFTDDEWMRYKVVHYEHQSRGDLVNDPQYKSFSVHFTAGGRFETSAKSYPNLVQAEIRFGT